MGDEFQYIKLPDGSYAKFRADASDEVIKSAIQKDFPDAFGPSPEPKWTDSIAENDKLYRQWKGIPEPTSHPMPGSFEGHPENVGEYVPATAGRAIEGGVDISRGNYAMGAHKILQAGGNALAPMAPMVAAGAPAATALGTAGGYVGGKIGAGLTHAVGGSEDQTALAGDVGNLIGGYLGIKTPKGIATIRSFLDKVKAVDPSLITDLRNEAIGVASPRAAHALKLAGKVSDMAGRVSEAADKFNAPAPENPEFFTKKPADNPFPTPPKGGGTTESAPITVKEGNTQGYSGKTPTRSNLAKNQRQLASGDSIAIPKDLQKQMTPRVPEGDEDMSSLLEQSVKIQELLKKSGLKIDPVTKRLVKIAK